MRRVAAIASTALLLAQTADAFPALVSYRHLFGIPEVERV